MTIAAYAAHLAGGPLVRYEYEPGPLGTDEVEIAVESCGVCHSDLSMLDDEWRRSAWPLVPGHEVVGTVVARGAGVPTPAVGARVGLGWYAASCLHCTTCLRGDHHLCATARATIVGRHGGFAARVRCHWLWAIPIPAGLDATRSGPLFCGGITVFTPLMDANLRPTERAGVVGIGGLGHLALRFLRAWGCEVTAFTSSPGKRDDLRRLGAHHVVDSHDDAALKRLAGSLDFLIVTVNVSLNWRRYLALLGPRGRMHVVGVVPEPIPVLAGQLQAESRILTGSPTGSPAVTATMLAFCARHGILPEVERYPFSRINQALAHLRAGKARYRVVLDNDLGA